MNSFTSDIVMAGIFLRDKVDQLKMQVSILQKGFKKKQKNPRYTLREKLFIL